jgi:CHRD domain
MRTRIVGLAFVLGLVAVGIAAAAANDHWKTHATGADEVPANDSQGQAQVQFRLSDDGSSLAYKLNVANIENVTQAHIHRGVAGANGPIVAFLYPSAPPARLIAGRSTGTLAEGTITAASLAVGPLAGQPLSALVDIINAGNAYVNVHTSQLPPGEIRGNLP